MELYCHRGWMLTKGEDNLSRLIFSYIMTSDDDGNEVRIIKSESSYPYFSYYIQDREKMVKQEPSSEKRNCVFKRPIAYSVLDWKKRI